MSRLTITALFVLLVLSACSSPGATPLPGTFAGSGEDGFVITVIVSDDLTIPEFDVRFSCGPIVRQQTVTLDPPYKLDAGSFDIELSTLKLTGKFKGDGSELGGSWESGSCSGNWDGQRTGD